MTRPIDKAVWRSKLNRDLTEKGLFPWILDIGGGVAARGGTVPSAADDLDGFIAWHTSYATVKSAMENLLGGDMARVMTQETYRALDKDCSLLQRLQVIEEVLEQLSRDYEVRPSLTGSRSCCTMWLTVQASQNPNIMTLDSSSPTSVSAFVLLLSLEYRMILCVSPPRCQNQEADQYTVHPSRSTRLYPPTAHALHETESPYQSDNWRSCQAPKNHVRHPYTSIRQSISPTPGTQSHTLASIRFPVQCCL
jgi:hypothetical protein